MTFTAVSKDRVACWAERTGSATRTAEAPLFSRNQFSHNQVTQHSSSYSSVIPSQGAVLIVDDDASVRRALHITLQTLGFGTCEAPSGEEALLLARSTSFDVVLLDINLPGMNGLETCHQLRRMHAGIAILMLTVRDSEEDKVNALDAGADDYVTKPFHIRELVARVRAAVRRAQAAGDSAKVILSIGDIVLDPARREVHKAGSFIYLTPKQFDLMHFLMAHAGLPVTHRRLLYAVWGLEHIEEIEYLRTFVHQVRKKIEDDPGNPQYLLTDLQIGYRFRENELSTRLSSAEGTNLLDI